MLEVPNFIQEEDLKVIYQVIFEVKVATEEGVVDWISDEIHVRGDDDAMTAIMRTEEYVRNPELYGLEIQGYKLSAISPIAEADY